MSGYSELSGEDQGDAELVAAFGKDAHAELSRRIRELITRAFSITAESAVA
jgi:hypothetical protein